jgi:hypothetical protein
MQKKKKKRMMFVIFAYYAFKCSLLNVFSYMAKMNLSLSFCLRFENASARLNTALALPNAKNNSDQNIQFFI